MKDSRLSVRAIAAPAGLALIALTQSQQPRDVAASSPAATRDERWRQDLGVLARELPQRHMKPFTRTTPEAFHGLVAQLDREIPSLDDDAILVRFVGIAASIGDAHTGVQWYSDPQRFGRVPIRFQWLKDGYYATSAAAPLADALGGRLRGVDGHEIAEVVAALRPALPHENEVGDRTLMAHFLVVPRILHGLGIAASAEHVAYAIEDRSGKTRTIDADAAAPGSKIEWREVAGDRAPLYRRDPSRPYWSQWVEEGRLLYIQYNQCTDDAARPFAKFADETLAVLREKPVERIAVDVRRNSGGNSEVIRPLERGLAGHPLAARGKLFVILGAATASSAMDNAIELSKRAHAVLIGEPTAGKPNSFGELKTFCLPNCGISIGYSTKWYQSIDEDPPSLAPDVLVETTIDDVRAGRDPVLEAILAR